MYACKLWFESLSMQDYIETERLLSSNNVNQEALLSYAREAADFGTNYQLPSLDYAINHYGQPDVAMFDFTCMYASENAALIREKHGKRLLVALVGDSLLEVMCCCSLSTKAHLLCVDLLVSSYSPFGQWVQAVLGAFWQPSIQPGWLKAGHRVKGLWTYWPRGVCAILFHFL